MNTRNLFDITRINAENSTVQNALFLNNNIVYSAQILGETDYEIYLYDGSQTIRITNDDINNSLYATTGNKIVWTQLEGNPGNRRERLYTYENGVVNTFDFSNSTLNSIFEDRVFAASDGNDNEIYRRSGGSITQITNNSINDGFPDFSGNQIVWLGNTPGQGDNQVYLYKGNNINQIATNNVEGSVPHISGSNVVWAGYTADGVEIFLYDGQQTHQLTNDRIEKRNPKIFGNKIIWQTAGRGYSLYKGTLSQNVDPEPEEPVTLSAILPISSYLAQDANGFEVLPFTVVEGYNSFLSGFGVQKGAGTPQKPPSFWYTTANGTAQQNFDYMPASGNVVLLSSIFTGTTTIEFNNSVATIDSPIEIINNDFNEPDKIFTFNFLNIENATWIGNQSFSYTITDTLRSQITNSIELFPKVENLRLKGSENINATGNSGNNILAGNVGNNILKGNEGDDTLIGGGGANTLEGGSGNDTYEINPNKDRGSQINDASGIDTLKVQGLVKERLGKGKIGLGRVGTSLIIDLNADGKINSEDRTLKLTHDLEILNFFSTKTGWQPGKGFIEEFGQFAGENILKLFSLEGKETVIGGDTSKPSKTVDKNYRNVQFRIISSLNSKQGENTDAVQHAWDKKREVWLITHGWNGSAIGNNIETLAKTIKQQKPNDIVITLDWSEASISGKLFNGVAATWIHTVANFAYEKLKEWGLRQGDNLNIIGHSLGSLLSAEIASRFGKVKTITALEPPSELNKRLIRKGYDLNGQEPGIQRPKSFRNFATISTAFLGTESVAANTDFAATAHESILFDFGTRLPASRAEHSWVIDAFVNLIQAKPLSTGNLFTLEGDISRNPELKLDQYERRGALEIRRKNRIVHEGIIKLQQIQPPLQEPKPGLKTSWRFVSFDYKAIVRNRIFGSDARDTLTGGNSHDALVGYANNDRLNGRAGNDSLDGGAGNDLLTGGRGLDEFRFTADNSSQKRFNLGIDRITDFNLRDDRIVLDQTAFRRIKGKRFRPTDFATVDSIVQAQRNEATITYIRQTGALYFNSNGSRPGFGSGRQFADLTNGLNLTANNFVIVP